MGRIVGDGGGRSGRQVDKDVLESESSLLFFCAKARGSVKETAKEDVVGSVRCDVRLLCKREQRRVTANRRRMCLKTIVQNDDDPVNREPGHRGTSGIYCFVHGMAWG